MEGVNELPWASLPTSGPQHFNSQGSLCHCISNMFKKRQQQQGERDATRRYRREQKDIQETPKKREEKEKTCESMLLGAQLQVHFWTEVLHDRGGISEESGETTPG